MRAKLLFFTLMCLISGGLQAFPPAPYYTLYGMVRDQVGQTLTAEGAVLILLKGGVEVGRTPINSALQLDQNYELNIRIDANRRAITGKIYSIERSTDVKTWSRVPFAIGAPAVGEQSYSDMNVSVLSAFTAPAATDKEFYRLTVR